MTLTAGKLLLVSSALPGSGGVGEIILKDLCALLPADTIVPFVVSVRSSRPSVEKVDCWIEAPPEKRFRPLPGPCGSLLHAIDVRSRFAAAAKRIALAIAAKVEACNAAKVWITLDSPTLIIVAGYLADILRVPLLTLVWDPPDYLALRSQWDRLSRRWMLGRFAHALHRSERVAVVSENMVGQYGRECGARCVVVRHALDGIPPERQPDAGAVCIGFAGTLYDVASLDALCEMLHGCGWTIHGRPVSLRMIGNYYAFRCLTAPSRVELLGWRGTAETRDLLGECHVLYLPQSFSPDWEENTRLAFPTKLSTYLSTGRPVIVHAPALSGVARFCQDNGCGVWCDSLKPAQLHGSINEMLTPWRYAQLCAGVRYTYDQRMSPRVMREQLAAFLGMSL